MIRIQHAWLVAVALAMGAPAFGQGENGPGTCHWYRDPDRGSMRHWCSEPDVETCGEGKICRQVTGTSAAWFDCFCLPVGVTSGSEPNKSDPCCARIGWKVTKRRYPGSVAYLELETEHDPRSFVEYFAASSIQPSGAPSQSGLFTLETGSWHSIAEFELVDAVDPTKIAELDGPVPIQLTQFSATVDSGFGLGYLSGTNVVTFDPAQPPVQFMYDEAAGTLDGSAYVRCTLSNAMYPEGAPLWVDIAATQIGDEWWVNAKAYQDIPLRAAHVWDEVDRVLHLTAHNADPGTTVFFAIAAAATGDVDLDRDVDQDDVALVDASMGPCGGGACGADVDRNGVVDDLDRDLVVANLGASDEGVTPLPICGASVSMAGPLFFSSVVGSDGVARLDIPVANPTLGYWHVQAVDPGNCDVSNLARLAVH